MQIEKAASAIKGQIEGKNMSVQEAYNFALNEIKQNYKGKDMFKKVDKAIRHAKKFEEIVLSGRGVDPKNYTKLPVMNTNRTSSALEKRRTALQKKANTIASKIIAAYCVVGSSDFPDLFKRSEFKDTNRPLDNVVSPDSLDPNEIISQANEFLNATSAEKQKLFKARVDKMYDFVHALGNVTDSNEFLDLMEKNGTLIYRIGEIQDPNGIKNGCKERYGFDVDQATFDKLSSIKDLGVDMTKYMNRLSYMASPLFPKYEDFTFMEQLSDWTSQNDQYMDRTEELVHYSDVDRLLSTPPKTNYIGNPMEISNARYFMEADIKSLIDDNLKSVCDKFHIEKPHFKDMYGKDIADEQAKELMKNRCNMYIYEEGTNRFGQLVVGKFGVMNTKSVAQPLFTFGDDKNAFRNCLNNIKDMLESQNPWYMKMRNVSHPGKYSQMLVAINDALENKDLSDSLVQGEILEDLKNKCQDYIDSKYTDGKKNTDLNVSRRLVAAKVLMSLNQIGATGIEEEKVMGQNPELNMNMNAERKQYLDDMIEDDPDEIENNFENYNDPAKQADKKLEENGK